MKYRKLRFAWTMAWGIVAVLVIIVWRTRTITFVQGHLVGVSCFEITSWPKAESMWRDTVSAYAQFGWTARDDSEWDMGTIPGVGGSVPEGFGLTVDPESPDVLGYAPHWFLLCVSAAIAIVPWLPGVARARHFSLRTLLIAITLAAVCFGLVVWAMRG